VAASMILARTIQHAWSLTEAPTVLVHSAMLDLDVRMSVVMLLCVKMVETAAMMVSPGCVPAFRSFTVCHS